MFPAPPLTKGPWRSVCLQPGKWQSPLQSLLPLKNPACAGHCDGFTGTTSLNVPTSAVREISPCLQRDNQGSARSRGLPQVTQLVTQQLGRELGLPGSYDRCKLTASCLDRRSGQ